MSVLFPGSRIVWLAALVAVVVGGLLTARVLNAKVLPLTGTNSVDVAAVIATAEPKQQVCVRDLVIPAGTGRLQVWMGFPTARGAVVVRGEVRGGGRVVPFRQRFKSGGGDWKTVTLPGGGSPGAMPDADVCFRTPNSAIDLGGASVQRLPDAPVSTVGREELASVDVGVRFLTPVGQEPRAVSQLDDALRRSEVFKAFPGGSLVLWLVLLGFPAVLYGAVRVAATVDGRSARGLAVRAGGLALFAGVAWAVMMPPFFGADESEHVAYAQHIAETNRRADAARTARAPYSSEETLLLGALHHNSSILSGGGRPRWDSSWERRFDDLDDDVRQDDGGGFTESASGHSPLYYAIASVPYRVLDGAMNLPQLNVAMRVWNALLASVVAVLAVLAAALVFPRARAAWWVAGCTVALQPVASSVAGTVNNDTLVNVLAALVIYLLLHAWRHGPRLGSMVALGVATVLLPVAKVTGFALWPVVVVGIVCVAVRHRGARPALLRLLALPAAAALAVLLWIAVVSPLLGGGTGALYNAHPAEPVVGGGAAVAGISRIQQAQYLLQTVLPGPVFGADLFVQQWPLFGIYVERGWGSFGWLNASLNDRTIKAIGLLLGVAWLLAAVAALQRRSNIRQWFGSALILGTAVASVVAFVAVAYATTAPRPVYGEQGRYLFPALVALGVLAGAGVLAFRDRGRQIVLGLVAGGMPTLALLAWMTALTTWFV
ncbi:DUF2142 domain-containing protein [Patulibacter americanus]|uniref:DUF2142 domain-containing protein n=1 Tax=Patulibacter americanus TaxID=588672 RepID=UPI0012FC4076|nr:DUF2142 domain-containing protein [Patulibacter americanus]